MFFPCKISPTNYSREIKDNKSSVQQLKINETILKERVRTLKNYDTWRKTKIFRINAQEMKRIENESLLSVAFNCGFRNQMNQIFQDLFKKSSKDISTQNSQQRRSRDNNMAAGVRVNKKRLSFVQYKNTKEQLLKVTRNLSPQSTKQKLSTKSIFFNNNMTPNKTPREISHLRKVIKTLPIMHNKEKTQSMQNSCHLKTTQQITAFKNINRKYQTEREVSDKRQKFENKQIINKKKYFFKQKVNQIMSTADSLLEEQVKSQSKQLDLAYKIKKLPELRLNKTTYWPEYKKYSMSVQDKNKINQIKSYYKQAFEQDFVFEDYILQIIRNMKQDFTQIEQQQKIEIVEAIKNAFELRFRYKINVEKDNYKRNVKSYLKCILDYRNERKREQVKANGIRRFKRQSLMQKIKMLVPQKNEDFQI